MTQMMPLLFVAAHMIGDFVTQTNWMASNKFVTYEERKTNMLAIHDERVYEVHYVATNFWFSAFVRAIHVTVYTLGFVLVLLLTPLSWKAYFGMLAAIWVCHFITDCRRWASPVPWPPKPIMVDQALHFAQLAVIAALFGL